jgi:ribosomal protein S27AE
MQTRTKVSSDTNPTAFIVNPKDRGRKSIKAGNKIYLQDGQNFEIELYNPLPNPILSDVRINGKSVSKTGLVLKPGERFYLDCFIDDKKKFIYKTYEINTDGLSEAGTIEMLKNNGTVEVYFYKEETLSLNNWVRKYDKIIERVYYPQYYPWYNPYPIYPSPWYNPIRYQTFLGGTTGTFTTGDIITTNGSNQLYNSSTINNDVTYGSCNSYSTLTNSTNSLETGRVEKGDISNQEFNDIDLEFEKYHISSVLYTILPESQKPIESTELKKKFCSECGQKLKGSEKFCPECGEKL